jgi:hypothetical protein
MAISTYMRRSFRLPSGFWTRDGEWLVARWPLRYHKGRVYDLETAVQIDADVPADPPPVEAALAVLLLPAMWRGRHRIRLPGPLHPMTRANLQRLQVLFAGLFPEFKLRPVPVQESGPRVESNPRPGKSRVGVFTSIGVDAFFSLLSNLDEIDDLILVRGYDISLEPENDALWNEVVEAGRAVADGLGKRLLQVRTNLRPFLDQDRRDWGLTHGAALAHVGLLLQPWLRAVYVPASFDVEHMQPWGSRPDLDPLWSTDRLQFVHHGEEFSRLEKIHRIVESPLVLRYLRVCNAHPDGVYNCGRCRKCLCTMLALDSAGKLQECATFPSEVTVSDIRAVRMWGVGGCLFLGELRDWWRETDPGHEFLPLVDEILRREAAADD